MNNNKWEVKVVDKFGNWAVDIYLIERGHKTMLAHFKEGQLELEEIKEWDEYPKPTMSLPMDLWEVIKATMINNKVREKNEVEAELKATKYHLQDMRKLLKLK